MELVIITPSGERVKHAFANAQAYVAFEGELEGSFKLEFFKNKAKETWRSLLQKGFHADPINKGSPLWEMINPTESVGVVYIPPGYAYQLFFEPIETEAKDG